MNLYGYVGGDPVNLRDPGGTQAADISGITDVITVQGQHPEPGFSCALGTACGDSILGGRDAALNYAGLSALHGLQNDRVGRIGLGPSSSRANSNCSDLTPNDSPQGGTRWTTEDFMGNYFGSGQTANLGAVGLGPSVRGHPPVRNEVGSYINSHRGGNGAVAGAVLYPNVTWNWSGSSNPLFSVGNTVVRASGGCTLGICAFEFSLRDRFSNPADLMDLDAFPDFELPGGTLYDIEYDCTVVCQN